MLNSVSEMPILGDLADFSVGEKSTNFRSVLLNYTQTDYYVKV